MMRKIIILALLFCCCFPILALADVPSVNSEGGIQPVSIDTVNKKVAEAEGYVLGAVSPIIKLMAKIMLILIAISLLAMLLTGTHAAKNAFLALLFVGLGIAIFTAIPQLTEWFVNLGNWLVN